MNQSKEEKTVIHAGYGQMIYGRWDTDYIESFERKHPDILVTTEAFMPQRLFDLLFSNKLDIVFSAAGCNSKEIVSSTILAHPLMIAMNAKDPLASKSVVDIYDLVDRSIIFLKSDPVFYSDFCAFFKNENLSVHMEYSKVSDTTFVLNSIAKTGALHLMSGDFHLPEGMVLKRVSYTGDQKLPAQSIRAYYLKNTSKKNEIRAFIRHSATMISKELIYRV